MTEKLFWTSLCLVGYCYFGYPLILYALATFFSRPVKKGFYEPTLSVVLSVWNEEDVIENKIKNILSLDYPAEKIEIVIGSDGSTDQTNALIRKFADPRIRLVESSVRQGKMATLNELVKVAKGEVIVFTDARQAFAGDALRQLAANLNDPKVGCVSGELVFSDRGGVTARGINLYWNYEKFIRTQESRIHSMLGATGAIYAIRRELYVDIPKDLVLDDMFVPFQIIRKGFRAVLDNAAKAYDEVADSPREEHRRKARTLYGNYQIFREIPGMFNPLKSPVAIQIFSHKLLRLLVPFFLIVIGIANGMLAAEPFYRSFLFLQVVFYSLAVLGGISRRREDVFFKLIAKIGYVPFVFCLMNFSALVGFFRFLGKKQSVTWDKARENQ